jgi:hypothetical protein
MAKRKKLTRSVKYNTAPSGSSKYGRKAAYLAAKAPDDRVWGFQVPSPKPWVKN